MTELRASPLLSDESLDALFGPLSNSNGEASDRGATE
jgi:hypothetical protein